jgi:hypothetical protein
LKFKENNKNDMTADVGLRGFLLCGARTVAPL